MSRCTKRISFHLSGTLHREIEEVARQAGRPVAELAREAITRYFDRAGCGPHSVFDVTPFESGAIIRPWGRDEIQDELLGPP